MGAAIGVSVGGFLGRTMGPILEKTKIGEAFKTFFSGIGDSFAPITNQVKRIISTVTEVFEGPGSIGTKIGKALGKLIIEIAHDQRDRVCKMLFLRGFYVNEIIKDYAQNNRCIVSTKI